jgi:hypothetical protein
MNGEPPFDANLAIVPNLVPTGRVGATMSGSPEVPAHTLLWLSHSQVDVRLKLLNGHINIFDLSRLPSPQFSNYIGAPISVASGKIRYPKDAIARDIGYAVFNKAFDSNKRAQKRRCRLNFI